jgi:hypothetical protein
MNECIESNIKLKKRINRYSWNLCKYIGTGLGWKTNEFKKISMQVPLFIRLSY